MVLSSGAKVGSYEILTPLGAGGMGEVYRARDTKLGRDVALKILPEAFANDAERMARFQREAQVLAALNHPNIASIYGLEESGRARALVMELVEGPTLAERIAQGPIPIDEALLTAKQICEGLEYAHERGIIHRDLKPANVKVRPDGTVKVLDFGLARALEESPAAGSISTSPTITAAATREGVILGSAAYMSPEQARGKTVDRRCDIWSFGALLFEMLSGQQAFAGEDVSQTLATVIMKEPVWEALPPSTPPRIRPLLHRCLAKDPRQRLQAIGEARIAIEEAIAHPESGREAAAQPAATLEALPWWRRALLWGVTTAVLGLALAGTLLWMALGPAPHPASPLRLSVELGADASLDENTPAVALSRDGNVLAFAARPSKGGAVQLFVRQLEHTQATPLAGTQDAFFPFFSPDGQWIAFFAQGKLKKVSVTGGAPLVLCDAPEPPGGDWGEDGNIVFAPTVSSGLFRVSEAGGTPTELTKLAIGEATHRWPQVLPGGKAVLFTEHNSAFNFDDASIMVQSLSTGQRKVVQRGGAFGRYLPGGYLVYVHGGTLFAAPFDLRRLEIAGTPVPAVEGVSLSGDGGAEIAFSASGTLMYLPGQGTSGQGQYPTATVFWLGQDGKREPLRNVPGQYGDIRLSPDGRRLGVELLDGSEVNIWVYEWQRDTMARLTLEPRNNESPAWTPDGVRIAFASDRAQSGAMNIYWQRADGAGEVQRLTQSDHTQWPKSWHPSGKFLAFEQQDPQTGTDIMILPTEGSEAAGWKPGKPFVFLNSPSNEGLPVFSPDGRWLAYWSDESGRSQVYVRPFPGPGGKWQISTNGGTYPTWSPTGKELFYQEEDGKVMVVGYTTSGSAFQVNKPRLWSPVRVPLLGGNRCIDVSRDGKRLAVVLKAPETQAAAKTDHITFFFNFIEELRRLATAGKP